VSKELEIALCSFIEVFVPDIRECLLRRPWLLCTGVLGPPLLLPSGIVIVDRCLLQVWIDMPVFEWELLTLDWVLYMTLSGHACLVKGKLCAASWKGSWAVDYRVCKLVCYWFSRFWWSTCEYPCLEFILDKSLYSFLVFMISGDIKICLSWMRSELPCAPFPWCFSFIV